MADLIGLLCDPESAGLTLLFLDHQALLELVSCPESLVKRGPAFLKEPFEMVLRFFDLGGHKAQDLPLQAPGKIRRNDSGFFFPPPDKMLLDRGHASCLQDIVDASGPDGSPVALEGVNRVNDVLIGKGRVCHSSPHKSWIFLRFS
jgi:hypothetical protein